MNSFSLDSETIQKAISIALAEDIGTGDVTTLSLIPAEARAEAVMKARQPLSVAGLDLAAEAYRQIDPSTEITYCCADGDQLNQGDILLHLKGSARAILTAERVSLNFIQRLSGIATLSRQFTDKIAGTKAKLLDTRKTTPGWRKFEKYAVTCGGATNHRFGLYDMILIKDNHLVTLRDAKPNAVAVAIQRARAAYPNLKVEVEADTLEQVSQAADAGADIILLDNMTNEMMSAFGGAEGMEGLVPAEDGDDEEDAETYTIVNSLEVNTAENKISDESPLGKALMGKKKGDEVSFKSPGGAMVGLKILEIKK